MVYHYENHLLLINNIIIIVIIVLLFYYYYVIIIKPIFLVHHDIVQMDIINMLMWSSNWCLYLNTNKCSVLHSAEKNTDRDNFMPIGEVDYKINNSQLE